MMRCWAPIAQIRRMSVVLLHDARAKIRGQRWRMTTKRSRKSHAELDQFMQVFF